jgi:8-oxo-dGTP pyrophosphatase MutT (NUDIX family)
VREETGLEIVDVKLVFSLVCRGETDYVAKAYYVGAASGEIHTDEPVDVRWVDPQVLLDGPFGEYNRALFDHVGIK